MSKKSVTAQSFSVNKSPLLLRFLLITHGFAAIASLTNALFWLYKLALLIAVAGSLWFYLRRYHYQFPPCRIACDEHAVWSLAFQNGEPQIMQILPFSVITTWLIVLHYRLENGRRGSVVIVNDALSETDYRALAVSLKISH